MIEEQLWLRCYILGFAMNSGPGAVIRAVPSRVELLHPEVSSCLV